MHGLEQRKLKNIHPKNCRSFSILFVSQYNLSQASFSAYFEAPRAKGEDRRMGNKLATQGNPQLDFYLHDLPGSIVMEQSLSNSCLLKCLKCVHDEGPVIVKVYIKRPPYTELKEYVSQLTALRDTLQMRACKNICPNRKFIITEKAGYMIRQYFAHNLHDRIGSRPFLAPIEKIWISFQLLKALQECQFYGICHGDIKSENVMLTSWNWVYLVDFACYKPTHIPEDGPAEFSFFFDNSGRRTCYLAPERFISGKDVVQGDHTHESDIFSLGCVIAELFLDGIPRTIFTLAQLLSYRKGEYNPGSAIDRIDSEPVRNLIKQMISKEPSERRTSNYYLEKWEAMGFPGYLETLHPYISNVMTQSPDSQVLSLLQDFPLLVDLFSGKISTLQPAQEMPTPDPTPTDKPIPQQETSSTASPTPSGVKAHRSDQVSIPPDLPAQFVEEYLAFASALPTDGSSLLCETDHFLMNLESFHPSSESKGHSVEGLSANKAGRKKRAVIPPEAVQSTWDASSGLPSWPPAGAILPGMTLLLSLLCSVVRHVRSPEVKVKSLMLFVKMSSHCDDNCRLQRIVPYIISLLHDESASVRSHSFLCLVQVLDMIQKVPASDVHVFPEYILPAVEHLSSDNDPIVKETFARYLAKLAEIARRFLESSQILVLKTHLPSYSSPTPLRSSSSADISSVSPLAATLAAPKFSNYDTSLQEIHGLFSQIISSMFWKDCPSCVKRALLGDISRMAQFFGKKKTSDFLLPLIVTFLNENDWELRSDFFASVVGVCEYVGGHSLESFVYPCILQALSDKEEFVINKAINSLASMAHRGLFRQQTLYDIARKTSPLLLHPNVWIRNSSISLSSCIAERLDLVDRFTFLIELIRPFVLVDIVDITCDSLQSCLLPPIPRSLYESGVQVCNFALQRWATAAAHQSKLRTQSLGNNTKPAHPFDPNDSFIQIFSQCMTEQGISTDDQKYLLLMSSYIKDVARHIASTESRANLSIFASDKLGITSYQVTLPSVGDSATPLERVEADNRWYYLTHFLTNPQQTGIVPYSNKARSLQAAVKEQSKIERLASLPLLVTPPELPDFGKVKRAEIPVVNGPRPDPLKNWRPTGTLVAHLTEHKLAVTRLRIVEDNQFFASCSHDGTVRIWDCQRLEKKVTNRSRLIFDQLGQGGKLLSLAILEQSHTIACGSERGRVSLFRVDFDASRKDAVDYKQCSPMEQFYSAEGAINAMEHYNNGTPSLLACATSSGRVHGFDLRLRREAFQLNNSSRAGAITSMVVDPDHHWLLTGTIRGCYTCWDLRFDVPVATWWQPGTDNQIHRMVHRQGTQFLATVGNGEIMEWDIAQQEPRTLWQVLSTDPHRSGVSSPSGIPPHLAAVARTPPNPQKHAERLRNMPAHSKTHRALTMLPDASYFLTGSSDKCLRYWSLANVSRSFIVSGLEQDGVQPRYSSERHDSLEVFQETPNNQNFVGFSGATSDRVLSPNSSHHDTILDIVVGEQPMNILISSARDGVIKVWK